VAVANLHLAACCIDRELLDDQVKQNRLVHSELITTLTAKRYYDEEKV